jgi:hypothetical protein
MRAIVDFSLIDSETVQLPRWLARVLLDVAAESVKLKPLLNREEDAEDLWLDMSAVSLIAFELADRSDALTAYEILQWREQVK